MISRTVEVPLRILGIVNDEGAAKTVAVLGGYSLVRTVAESERDAYSDGCGTRRFLRGVLKHSASSELKKIMPAWSLRTMRDVKAKISFEYSRNFKIVQEGISGNDRAF
jgi:hypothetical protein